MKTILFFDHTAVLGGGEISLLHLVQRLDRRRFRPIVVLGREGPLQDALASAGVETHLLPLSSNVGGARKDSLGAGSLLRLGAILETGRYVGRLARLIKELNADLLHANSLKADILGGIAGKMARVPVLWHIRDRIEKDYLPASVTNLLRILCRLIPDYILANSAATLATLHLPQRQLQRRAAFAHEGVPDRISITPAGAPEFPLLGLVGRITRWKGQHVFIRAAAKVRERFPEARFQIIGSALFGEESYEQEVRNLSRALSLDAHLTFTGFRADVAELIDQLSVLVHASITGEPFGQVVIEGMQAGKPVIATRGGGIPEIVEDQVTGLLVEMNDVEGMAAAMESLLADPAAARRMGEAGRLRVKREFTADHFARNVEGFYDRIFAGPQPAESRNSEEEEAPVCRLTDGPR